LGSHMTMVEYRISKEIGRTSDADVEALIQTFKNRRPE